MQYTYLTKDLVDKYKSIIEIFEYVEQESYGSRMVYEKKAEEFYGAIINEVIYLAEHGEDFTSCEYKVDKFYNTYFVELGNHIFIENKDYYEKGYFTDKNVKINCPNGAGVLTFKWELLLKKLKTKVEHLQLMDSHSVTMDQDEIETYFKLKNLKDELGLKESEVHKNSHNKLTQELIRLSKLNPYNIEH